MPDSRPGLDVGRYGALIFEIIGIRRLLPQLHLLDEFSVEVSTKGEKKGFATRLRFLFNQFRCERGKRLNRTAITKNRVFDGKYAIQEVEDVYKQPCLARFL